MRVFPHSEGRMNELGWLRVDRLNLSLVRMEACELPALTRSHRPASLCVAVAVLWAAFAATAACGGGQDPTVGKEESQPVLSLEVPAPGEVLLPFRVSGWAIDRGSTSGPGVERIEVLDGGCNGELLGEAELALKRDDVGAQYGERFTMSGWQFVVDQLSVGEHVLGVRLFSELGGGPACETVAISVV